MRNRLPVLMAEKQIKTNQIITAAVVARETGLSRQAIYKWIHGDVSEFREDIIERLCDYFECEVGDLLYIDRSGSPQPETAQ